MRKRSIFVLALGLLITLAVGIIVTVIHVIIEAISLG